LDCNANSIPDICDLANGTSRDCNNNGVPDECDIASSTSQDANNNGVPDECEGACCTCGSCADLLLSQCQSFGGIFSGLGVLCGETGSCTPPTISSNDACAQAAVLASEPVVSAPFDNRCASLDGPAAVDCPSSQPFGADLWYKYVAPCTGTVTASLCNTTDFDSIMDVYGGGAVCPCPTTSSGMIVCGDDTCGVGGGPSRVTFNVTAGMCYTIRVAGWADQIGTGILDVSYNTACTVVPVAPIADPSGIDKSRFISFSVPAGTSPPETALRVKLMSLHNVVPPYPNGNNLPIPFTLFQGQSMWVGPPAQYVESGSDPTPLMASKLQCTPYYQNWSTVGLLHVTGEAILPSSSYDVATLAASCMGNEATCSAVSVPLTIVTARSGDVVIDGAANFADIQSLVSKYQNKAGAPIKARSKIATINPRGLIDIALPVDFSDIAADVGAYQGKPYPYKPGKCSGAPTTACKDSADCGANGPCMVGVINIAPNRDFAHISACINAYLVRAYPYTIGSCP
jgi:hypothetical protein